MPEIKHRQDKASPEIEFAEIYIPDDRRLGTRSFKTVIKAGVAGNINEWRGWVFVVKYPAPPWECTIWTFVQHLLAVGGR